MNVKFKESGNSVLARIFLNILFFSGIFILLILIDSNYKPRIYFDIQYFTEKKGPTQLFFSEIELDFTEENSKTEILNLSGVVRFPVEKSALLKMSYLRLDPCSCDGEFHIQDWGLSKGFRNVSLPVQAITPFHQVEIKEDRYVSTGFDPQLHFSPLDFSNKYELLMERDITNYLQIFVISLLFYLLALLGYRKFTFWRFIFIFPLFFVIVLYFELRSDWKILLFTYQQEAAGEALQAILILSAAFISFYIFHKIKRNRSIKILHFAIGLVLLILFLEETSYLQRVFLFETPNFIGSRNYQNETTIHNLSGVNETLNYLFLILGLYGTFSWLLLYLPQIKKFSFFNYIIFPRVTVLYYFALACFYYTWNNKSKSNVLIPNVQEAFELLLTIAILIYVVRNFNQILRLKMNIIERSDI
jgi:hypothetical protein